MKEGFAVIDDILLEIAKEEGLSEREIKDLWKHQKAYIQKMMDSEDVYSIFLPYIGTLSLNVKQFYRELKNKTKRLYAHIDRKIKELKMHPNYGEFENSHKRVTGVNRLARKIKREYHTGIENAVRLIPREECWDIIEKYSNGIYDKREVQLIKKRIPKKRKMKRKWDYSNK